MPKEAPETTDAKLDRIVTTLEAMNRRDKLRTWGGFVHGIFSLIPLAIFLFGLWYVTQNGKELLKQLTDTAASSAAEYTKNQGTSFYDQMVNQFKNSQKK